MHHLSSSLSFLLSIILSPLLSFLFFKNGANFQNNFYLIYVSISACQFNLIQLNSTLFHLFVHCENYKCFKLLLFFDIFKSKNENDLRKIFLIYFPKILITRYSWHKFLSMKGRCKGICYTLPSRRTTKWALCPYLAWIDKRRHVMTWQE